MSARLPMFVKHDLDGFFGLFIDNLVQLLLIVSLCSQLCGMGSAEGSRLLYQMILPGAAVSILIGNIAYAWQAHRLAKKEGRSDVTALPYGINTPSLLVYIFFVMVPVFQKTKSADMAWKMGLIACLGSGIIEFWGSFVAETVRRRTPRAALLSTLAGIAVGFIAMKFCLEIFERPLVAMLPFAVIMITYFARVPFPWGIPGGLVAVVLGTACAWLAPFVVPSSWGQVAMDPNAVSKAWATRGFYLPTFVGKEIWELLKEPKEWIGFMSVIVPMGLFNVIGSLQNIESAEAAGDRYPTAPSLAINGIGTISAALFGSCFPTTIYIGHPGWKGLGARAGYSTLNGLAITAICLTGTVALINSIVPMQAGIAIVLWIGIIITAQAFQATPSEHAPAVAIGLFPAIAAWGQTVMIGAFIVAGGATIQAVLDKYLLTEVNGFLIHGLLLMERGYIFTCMILAAISALLIDRKFYSAAVWSLVGAFCAGVGLTHAYTLQGNNVDYLFFFSSPAEGVRSFHAIGIAVGYLLFALVFVGFGNYCRRNPHLTKLEH
jgi:AGZA family xanthine/uracil permease-like MFS transporter